jgi:hypothetical protein
MSSLEEVAVSIPQVELDSPEEDLVGVLGYWLNEPSFGRPP